MGLWTAAVSTAVVILTSRSAHAGQLESWRCAGILPCQSPR